MAGLSLIYQPPPLWFALVYLFLYLNLCVGGVIFSGFSMFANVVTVGPKTARGVAFTFDDGPDPKSTPQILDMLDAAGATATFFVIGRKAKAHPELVAEMCERGHAVGIHSYAHSRIFSLYSPSRVRADLERAIEVLHEITGVRPTMFRAPIGHISPSIAKVARDLGLVSVGWSVRALDGFARAKADAVADRVMRGLKDGAIVLLHDASERGDFLPVSVTSLPTILESMQSKQLPFVRVDRWLGQGDAGAVAEAHDATS